MDMKIPWKSLSKQDASSSKWGAFSSKQIAFFAIVGLALVAGILLRASQFFGQPEVEQNAPVTVETPPPPAAATPPAPATPPVETTESQVQSPPPVQQPATPIEQSQQTGEAAQQADQANAAVEQAEQPGSVGSGTILVSRQPVAMLASPSASAPTLYGFPAGRPFRVIGHNGGFAQIKDLRSGASGWIDEAALAPPPGSPAVSAPSQPSQSKPVAASRKSAEPSTAPKPKAPKKDSQVTAGSEETTEPVQTAKRPGLFGGGGLFGGIFGGGNGNAN
jgi:hypothetical protein